MPPVVWISEPALGGVRDRLASGAFTGGVAGVAVDSLEAFRDAMRAPAAIGFIDHHAIAPLDDLPDDARPPAIVVVCQEPLGAAITWLKPHAWLAHVVHASMFDHPFGHEHLTHVVTALTATTKLRLLDWLGPEVNGRRIRLSHANKRAERLERMTGFLDGKGVGARTIEQLRDAAEELLTNAFYDAPVAAGAAPRAISRTVDVTLPDELACDLAYGCAETLAVVRVKDPFGSLTRSRLVDVLTRCSRSDMAVEVDESMGGAGLGMWRVFSSATFVAVSVSANRHTEILVGIAKRAPGPKPFAFHLFFQPGSKPRSWKLDAGSALGAHIEPVS